MKYMENLPSFERGKACAIVTGGDTENRNPYMEIK